MKYTFAIAFMLIVFVVSLPVYGEAEIADMSFKQRFPWNGKIDITYRCTGLEVSAWHKATFSAACNGKRVSWYDTFIPTETEMVRTRTVDAAATSAFGTNEVGKIVITANIRPLELDSDTGVTYQNGNYLVMDLATCSMEHVLSVQSPSAFDTDENRSTKMVFREIPPGKFYMQGTSSSNGSLVILTNRYYIAIYPVTISQYYYVMNGTTSTDYNPLWNVPWSTIRGAHDWPVDRSVDAGSVLGKLRAKMSGCSIDMPTEAQYERACRAGTRTEYYFGDYSNYPQYARIGGVSVLKVGSLLPNAWGMYDITGDCHEWTLNGWTDTAQFGVEPLGPSGENRKVCRGAGAPCALSTYCSSNYRDPYPAQQGSSDSGFRMVIMDL